ncbi:hypothetical protein H312_03361 [Anncaliia algerae PRA339]|uniref:Helix-turn-helix type 11 domain-containing protein n=1 Tax=Anncaliia algerae PRA339 TaxID=1288291 RepID=A0A059EX04_9MICR|nr:hypothetical protein H312_03361 [Anncaliia algerae PRA339]
MVKKRRELIKDSMTIICSILETNTSNKQIAETLDLSLKTVWKLLKKLDLVRNLFLPVKKEN